MSQRLHVGLTDSASFDCILTNTEGSRDKIKNEWLLMDAGWIAGPWKIYVGDIDLFRKIEPIIKDVFRDIGEQYPESVSMFYCNNQGIENPSQELLNNFLAQNEKNPQEHQSK